MIRKIRRSLNREAPSAPGIFRRQSRSFTVAETLVRAYYACLLLLAALLLPSWSDFFARKAIDPLWPIFWMKHLDWKWEVYAILAAHLLSALAAAVLPERRWIRVLAWIGLLEMVALNNSFGKIGHSQHLWIWTSFLLIFLPGAWSRAKELNRGERQAFLTVFWGCQALLLLTYSLAGTVKLGGACYQLVTGQTHAFDPQAMPLQIAERLIQTHSTSLLGPWFIEHMGAAWGFMMGTLYLQFFAFIAIFRPSLQRPWALGLILFHLGTFFTMTITFPYNIFLLALFLFNSPFIPPSQGPFEWLRKLPLFGNLFQAIQKRLRSIDKIQRRESS